MKLYLLSQKENDGYDTFDSCIVCAENESDAKSISPGHANMVFAESSKEDRYYQSWAFTKEAIECEEIGEANNKQKRGIILSSFNAA